MTGCRIEVWHTGLNEHRLLRAPDGDVLENKVNALVAAWEEKWGRVSSKQRTVTLRVKGKEQAEASTQEAQNALREAEGLLKATLSINDAVDWTALEDHAAFTGFDRSPYPDVTFGPSGAPKGIKAFPLPQAPDPGHQKYQPQLGLLDKLFAKRKAAKVAAAERLYAAAHDAWREQERKVEEATTAAKKQFEAASAAHQEADAAFRPNRISATGRFAIWRPGIELANPRRY